MDLASLVNELRGFSFEKEWFEFKENWMQPAQLGEYIKVAQIIGQPDSRANESLLDPGPR